MSLLTAAVLTSLPSICRTPQLHWSHGVFVDVGRFYSHDVPRKHERAWHLCEPEEVITMTWSEYTISEIFHTGVSACHCSAISCHHIEHPAGNKHTSLIYTHTHTHMRATTIPSLEIPNSIIASLNDIRLECFVIIIFYTFVWMVTGDYLIATLKRLVETIIYK